MTDFFLVLVNRSLLASVVVAAVLLLRLLFQKAPKWVHCLLWALVAVQLLCPFQLESKASLMPASAPITQQMLDEPLPDYKFETPSDQTHNTSADQQEQSIQIGHSASPVQILSLIWLVGMCAMLLYTAITYGRLRSRMATAVKRQDNIYECDRVGSPFVLGIVKPKIYLPFGLEEPTRSLVLAHEQAHLARHDHWWKPLGFLLLAVYWFNPLLWLAYVLLCRDIELACDEKVIQTLDHDQRADYSQALLSGSVPRRMIAACPLAFGECDVKTRIKHVLSYKKPAFWILSLAIVACILAAFCFLTVPPTPQYDFEADPITAAVAGIDKQRSLNRSELDELTSRLDALGHGRRAVETNEVFPASHSTVQLDMQTKTGRRILIGGFYDGWVTIQSEDTLCKTRDKEFCTYLETICQRLNQSAAVNLEDFSPFGQAYKTAAVAYESAIYSFGYTADTAPLFALTPGGGLTVFERQDGQFWKDFSVPDGGFTPTTLTEDTFDALFLEAQVWQGTSARELREHNVQTWQAVLPGDCFYLLLEQANSDLYLAFGYVGTSGTQSSIRWVFQLMPAGSAPESSETALQEITALLDTICASPVQASAPGAYIQAHQAEYNSILNHGDNALRYCFSAFLKGNQTDLRGHIMAQVCQDILDSRQEVYEIGDTFSTGQDWFDGFQAEAKRLEETTTPDNMETSYAAAWLLLTMQESEKDA